MNILDFDIAELSEKLNSGAITSVEATEACLKRIKDTADLNTFVTVCADSALEKAKQTDEKRKKKQKVGALAGVPIAIKDNICTKNIRTTCASKFLENFVPPYDATVMEKLNAADAVILGKTNMDEFAMGSTGENSAFGAVKNGCDPTRVAGGSSAGSASAVSAKQCFATLGSDTGGSIRQPSAFCGVVGLKPTYSAVSRYGLVAFASSLDQIGPIAKTTQDCKTVYSVIAGHDCKDSTSSDKPIELSETTTGDIKGKRVGIARQFFADGLSDEVRKPIEEAIRALKDAGASVVELSIDSFDSALACYYVLSSAEAASNLARYDGVKYGSRSKKFDDLIDLYYQSRTEFFGDEVKRRIMIGNYVLSSGYYDAYYLKAQKVRTLIKNDFDAALKKCDVLIAPVAPTAALQLGRKVTDHTQIYLSDLYTVPVNIAGLPALSVPVKRSPLPIGCQFIGRAFDENTLFEFGKCLEVRRVGV